MGEADENRRGSELMEYTDYFSMPEPSIVKETDDFIITDKPSGLLTIAGRGESQSDDNLADMLRKKYGEIYVLHRLDRDVSGLVMFARNAEAHRYYSGLFETREITKMYTALVCGKMTGRGEINKPLSQRGSGRVSVAFDGKHSLTRWRVMRNYGNDYTLAEAEIITGRRHQIRVHFYSEGHPIAGDSLYGNKETCRMFPRIMLHSWKMRFKDRNGKNVYAEAEPPSDFLHMLEMI
ncbi:MAG: RluA family pseudouridine synthase [Elusimicrobiales bacterium]|nr:RluA family pseudouridine synthase [Elusimicrobiales bacterium]